MGAAREGLGTTRLPEVQEPLLGRTEENPGEEQERPSPRISLMSGKVFEFATDNGTDVVEHR